jgi:DNA-binding NarL/FixJ family response regulator
VLLVDDHTVVRQGLRCTLEVNPSIEVVGEASDGEEVLACIEKVQPTVVVIDIIAEDGRHHSDSTNQSIVSEDRRRRTHTRSEGLHSLCHGKGGRVRSRGQEERSG